MGKKEFITEAQEKEVVRICQELVRIKSFNPPGNELPLAEFIAPTLRKAGLDVELIKHSPRRASVLACLKSPRKIPALLFNGHLDTVPIGADQWNDDPFCAKIENGRVFGRGTSDMKGGLAAMIVSIKRLAELKLPLRGDLLFAATAGEEIDSLGAIEIASLLKHDPIQGVIISEPTENEMVLAEKGALWLEITTRGKTAHGSMPEIGNNAVMMMISFINEFSKLKFPYRKHPLLGRFSQSINTISGGVKTNVVPDQCVITVDMRTLPGQNHQAIVKKVKDLIKVMKERFPAFKARVTVTNDRFPIETLKDEPIVRRFAEVLTALKGKRPIPKGVYYYTDGTVFVPSLKCPMIICGPGHPQLAHQPNEYIEISKLIEAIKIYTSAAIRLLQ